MSIEEKIRGFARVEQPPAVETRHSAIELVDLLRQLRIYNISAVLEGKTIVVHGYGRSIANNPISLRWTVWGNQTLFDWKEDWED